MDGLNTRIILSRVILLRRCLVPIQDAAHKGRDEEGVSLSGGDGLYEREHQREIAVDAMLRLKDPCGLDAFPCGGDFDENSRFIDSNGFVQLHSYINKRLIRRLLYTKKDLPR